MLQQTKPDLDRGIGIGKSLILTYLPAYQFGIGLLMSVSLIQ